MTEYTYEQALAKAIQHAEEASEGHIEQAQASLAWSAVAGLLNRPQIEKARRTSVENWRPAEPEDLVEGAVVMIRSTLRGLNGQTAVVIRPPDSLGAPVVHLTSSGQRMSVDARALEVLQ